MLNHIIVLPIGFHAIVIQILVGNASSKPREFFQTLFGLAGICSLDYRKQGQSLRIVLECPWIISPSVIRCCQDANNLYDPPPRNRSRMGVVRPSGRALRSDSSTNENIICPQDALANSKRTLETMDGLDKVPSTMLKCTEPQIRICNI